MRARPLAVSLVALAIAAAVVARVPAAPEPGAVSTGAAGAPPAAPVDPAAAATAPRISAAAAVLMDAATGTVLYARRPHQRRDIASTTKVMTAVLALEYGRPDSLVTVSRRAAATPGSRMGLRPGEAYRLSDLLAGLMLNSGNDAAVAIAEHLSGSVEAFAALMTERARRLGLRDTRFQNPHGLTEPGHFSSAYDLALLTRHALTLPGFLELVCRRRDVACEARRGRRVPLHNTNRLLWRYAFAEGVKTGTTAAAGRCLVAAASRQGHRLIAVLLSAPRRFRDAEALLEWGFETFQLRRPLRAGERVAHLPVAGGTREWVSAVAAEDLWVVAPRAAWAAGRLRWRVELPDRLAAPVPRHRDLGRVVVTLDGRPLATARLVSGEAIPRRSWRARVADLLLPVLRAMAGS